MDKAKKKKLPSITVTPILGKQEGGLTNAISAISCFIDARLQPNLSIILFIRE